MDGQPLMTGLMHMPADTYHRDPAPAPSLSSTLARLIIGRSPLHAWTASPRLNPDWEPDDRKTFDIGRAAHRQILGAGGEYATIPEETLAANGAASTKEAKAFIADCREAGLTPLKAAEVEQIEALAVVASEKLASMGITLDPDRSELAVLAEIDGVWCRAMIDNAPADPRLPLYDFKTTENASPEACMRAIMNYGYDVQAAHYLDTWKAATGEDRRFRFIFQEKAAPYEVCVVELHDAPDDEADWMLDARSKAREARRLWGECLQLRYWPGYPPRVAVVGAPAYYRQSWADRAIGQPVIKPKPTAAALAAAYAAQHPKGLTE